jgi:hypothetical protein
MVISLLVIAILVFANIASIFLSVMSKFACKEIHIHDMEIPFHSLHKPDHPGLSVVPRITSMYILSTFHFSDQVFV